MTAYERLIDDAVDGDLTLFARADSVAAAWGIVDSLLDGRSDEPPALSTGNLGASCWRRLGGTGGRLARTWSEVDVVVRVVVSPSEGEAADLAADTVTSLLAEAIATRGTASLALSGGKTPAGMVRKLAIRDVAWASVHVFQVDERAVSLNDPARNWSMLQPLVECVPESNRHPMPVEASDADLKYWAAAHCCGVSATTRRRSSRSRH